MKEAFVNFVIHVKTERSGEYSVVQKEILLWGILTSLVILPCRSVPEDAVAL